MSKLALLGGAPVRTAPFPAWPVFDETEERALLQVLRGGRWWRYTMGEAIEPDSADAADSAVVTFQRDFAQAQGSRFGIACSTGTAALEVGLKALGVRLGDDVVVPPYTFVATASAPMLIGARPVFCDIEVDTWNLDPTRLEEAITPNTRAIVPVHFAGLAADMASILAIAERRGIPVLEDAAHAHGGTWNGRGLGSIGAAGTFSFQASKNMTAGEGGLITTDDPAVAELCDSYIWCGRKIGRPWYEHHRLGWNYRMTEFQAAILGAQLARMAEQSDQRLANGLCLNARLAGIPGIRPLAIPSYATRHAFHIYALRFDEALFGVDRATFLAAMAAEGIPCSSGYASPLYRNPMFAEMQYPDACPVAERACSEAVWFEHRLLLGTRRDIDDIVLAAARIYDCRSQLTTISNKTSEGVFS
jgi:dTDP-4-amino-4,6-dideoxygalactose transaminase